MLAVIYFFVFLPPTISSNMFKKLSLLVFICIGAYQLSAYNINIKIKGASKRMFYLGYYYGDKQYLKDSTFSDASGKMVFKGKETLQGGIYLIASADKSLLFDFVVTEQVFSLETDTLDYTGNMKVKGSIENTAFFEYSQYTSVIAKEVDPFEKAYKKAKEDKDTAALRFNRDKIIAIEKRLTDYRLNVLRDKPNLLISKVFNMMRDIEVPDPPILPNGRKDSLFGYNYYKTHFFDNFDLSDDRMVYTPVFHSRIEYYITKVIPQIPDSINKAADFILAKAAKSKEITKWCIFWITNHYETSQFMGMDAVFVHMADKYYTDSIKAFWVDETLRFKIANEADNIRNNLIGKVAPNLIMPDTGYVMRELHAIKAKYTMLLYWDATCGRCKEEIPRLKVLYDKLANEQHSNGKFFEVYAISLTAEAEEWKKFVQENKLKWLNVSDLYNNTKFRKLYNISSTPVIYLLNEKKEIIAKRLSVEQVEDFISKGIE